MRTSCLNPNLTIGSSAYGAVAPRRRHRLEVRAERAERAKGGLPRFLSLLGLVIEIQVDGALLSYLGLLYRFGAV